MQAAIGHITDNESFELAVCGCKSAGMSDNQIIEYLKQSPKFGKEAVTRVKSFKAEGGRTVASLIKWAKDSFGFQPSWAGTHSSNWHMNLSSYPTYSAQIVPTSSIPAISSALPRLKKFTPLKVPFNRYAHLSGIEQLKKFFAAIRDDGELSQVATSYGKSTKTPLLSLDELRSVESVAGIESLIHDKFSDAGAWVRANPVHDERGKNESVSNYKYFVLEGDGASITEQYGAIVGSYLPIDAVTYSGSKSLHALIRLDAKNEQEYKELEERVIAALERHGLTTKDNRDIDRACMTPDRLTRLPGIKRGNQMQQLIAVREDLPNAFDNIVEWLEYKESGSSFPRAEFMTHDVPAVTPQVIIKDIFKQGYVLSICGNSKVGKSWFAMKFAAELIKPNGGKLLNFPIEPKADGTGYKVYYVNTEIPPQEFDERMNFLMASTNSAEYWKNLKTLHLRGYNELLRIWKNHLIKDVEKWGADVLIFDPVYCIIDGDENAAKDMNEFFNNIKNIQFETDTALAYVHHQKKGDLRDTEPRDRLAGSGVFARNYDSLIDITGISQNFLTASGLETEKTDDRGNRRISLHGVRIEFDLRGGEDYSPMHFWRDGGKFIEDKSGILAKVWREGKTARVSKDEFDIARTQLGDKVQWHGKTPGTSRSETKQKETSMLSGIKFPTRENTDDENPAAKQSASVRIMDRLPRRGPMTQKEIMVLADITSESTARTAIKGLISDGKMEEVESGRQGVSGAGTKYFVTAPYRLD